MSDITPSQLDLIRTTPQGSELHLSVYQPNTVLACQVDSPTIAKGARTIPYYNVTIGSYLNVRAGMVLLVGSTPGASDKGKVRIRSITSSAFVVAENSDVQWADELHLTVLNLIAIAPIFPRIIADPSNAENTLWYKDYDIVYSNQNDLLGSFVCMGPNRAGNLGGDGKCSFWFDATGTEHANKELISYSWIFPGASNMTGSNSITPGWVEYQSPQHTTAILIVTSNRGSVDTSYRYVSIYPQNENTQGWEITNIQGSRQSGGYVMTILAHTPIEYNLYDDAPVVIYKKSWYGSIESTVGGNAPNCGDIYFSGYILQGSIKWDYEKSTVEFQVGSITEIMKEISGFAISVENTVNTPATWYQIQGNNLRKSIYHFLRWHSTILSIADFKFKAADRYIQFFDSDRGSVYDGVASVLKSALLGELVADRQGKLWAETSMEATNTAKSEYPSKFTLIKDDWIGEPSIQELVYDVLSYIELGGIKYNPTLSTDKASVAYLACAPGITPSSHGKVEAPTGLALISQNELNQIVGNVFAYRNAKKPTISIDLKGQYLNLDIAPLESIQIVVNSEDTAKKCVINAPYFVSDLQGTYSGDTQYLKTKVTLHEITEGVPGDTIVIPDTPPSDGEDDPVDDIPSFPIIPPVTTTPSVANIVAILIPGYGIYHNHYYEDGTYEWISDNDSFTPEEKAALMFLEVSLGTIYTATDRNAFKISTDTGVRATIGTEAFFLEHTPDSPGVCSFYVMGLGTDFTSGKMVAITGRNYPEYITATYVLSGDSLQYVNNIAIGIEGYPRIIGYGGAWYYTSNEGVLFATYFRRFNSGMSDVDYSLGVDGPYALGLVHATAADFSFLISNTSLIVRSNQGETLVRNDGDVGDIDCDPTGQCLMYVALNQIYYSNDQAISWTSRHDTLPCPYISSGRVVNLGTTLDWMITFVNPESGGEPSLNIWRTADAGLTWTNCIGNLFELGVPTNGTVTLIRRG